MVDRPTALVLSVSIGVLLLAVSFVDKDVRNEMSPYIVSQNGSVTRWSDGHTTFVPGSPEAKKLMENVLVNVGDSITKTTKDGVKLTVTLTRDEPTWRYRLRTFVAPLLP